jgi:hypothetical protein
MDTDFTKLWRHVILQAVIDFRSSNMKLRQEVLDWLTTDDFIDVCSMAEVRVDATKQLFR